MFGESRLDGGRVAEEQRRVEAGASDRRVQREQPFGAIAPAVGRRLDELIHRGAELERQLFDALVQRLPGIEAVLARDHRLRVVERERPSREIGVGEVRERRQNPESLERCGVVRAGGAEQVFRLPFELLEVRALG